jgi:putative flippase GtrA
MKKQILSHKDTFLKLIRFGLSGGISAVTTLVSLFIFKEYFHISEVASSNLAYSIGIIVNFTLQRLYTFKSVSAKSVKYQFVLFVAGAFVNMALNSALMLLLLSLGVWYMLAQFLVLGVLAIANFIYYKLFVFK